MRREGAVIGRVRSCGYGHTVHRNIALASVPTGLEEGAGLTVDMFERHVPAVVQRDVLYDPEGTRIRG